MQPSGQPAALNPQGQETQKNTSAEEDLRADSAAKRNEEQLLGLLTHPVKPQTMFEENRLKAQFRWLRDQVAARQKVVDQDALVNQGTLDNPVYEELTREDREELARLDRIREMLQFRDDKEVERLMYHSGGNLNKGQRAELLVLLVRKFTQRRLDFSKEWPTLAALASVAHVSAKHKQNGFPAMPDSANEPSHAVQLAEHKQREARILSQLADRQFQHAKLKHEAGADVLTRELNTASFRLRDALTQKLREGKMDMSRLKLAALKQKTRLHETTEALKKAKAKDKVEAAEREKKFLVTAQNHLIEKENLRRAMTQFEQLRPKRLRELKRLKVLSQAQRVERDALSHFAVQSMRSAPLFSPPAQSSDRLALCKSAKAACETPNVRCMCQKTCMSTEECKQPRNTPALNAPDPQKQALQQCSQDFAGSLCKQMRASCLHSASVEIQCCVTCAEERRNHDAKQLQTASEAQRARDSRRQQSRTRIAAKATQKVEAEAVTLVTQLKQRVGDNKDLADAAKKIHDLLSSGKIDPTAAEQLMDQVAGGRTPALKSGIKQLERDKQLQSGLEKKLKRAKAKGAGVHLVKHLEDELSAQREVVETAQAAMGTNMSAIDANATNALRDELRTIHQLTIGAMKAEPGKPLASKESIDQERLALANKHAAANKQRELDAESQRTAQGGVKYHHGTVPWEDAVRELPAASTSSRGNQAPSNS